MSASVRRAGVALAAAVAMLLVPADPAAADNIRNQQWHLAVLGIEQAQRVSQGDGVVVAVLDSGVDVKHAELAGAVLAGVAYGEGNNTGGRVDDIGHGTAMAGLIAGRGLPNGGGVLGIAPKAMILPVQVVRSGLGLGIPEYDAAGIDWAVEHGAKVINMSLDIGETPTVRAAVERALQAGVVVVAAAGNTPEQKTVGFPANVPGVIAVAGTDRDGNHAQVSVTGPEVLVAAPAVDVVSTHPGAKYAVGSGTSEATAIVSGVVALVRAKYPELSAAEVVHRITATATDKGKPGRDEEFGFGIVNPVAALTADVAPMPPSSSAGGDAGGEGSPGGSGVGAKGSTSAAGVVAGGVGVGLVLVAVGVWAIRRRARD
ncbi:S8 family serine peptidase [Dactylosporangium salmoneum]|uniref:Type VII secretion-associated serine protease mycosin n=1 Tax=Dactylosporangium salmoneum TaxID=53361 RepID=A0ABN3GJ06_9ACTN